MRDSKFFLLIFLVCLIFVACYPIVYENIKIVLAKTNLHSLENGEFKELFEVQTISEDVKNKIYGISWRDGSPVRLESLRYIIVSYWGFDDKPHNGELIVHENVAKEVMEIFKELYEGKYPIDKINLIDNYNANDDEAMKDNNTSAFCYREKPNSKELSIHSYGLSIDINPVQNPYIKGDVILPPSGSEFLDRSVFRKGMIIENDLCYKAFISRGWSWGGKWIGLKDYQHFEKN